tara:strand:- start:29 stop:580 length:552 start_codon:yes stop_codon:yes gene_type:complete
MFPFYEKNKVELVNNILPKSSNIDLITYLIKQNNWGFTEEKPYDALEGANHLFDCFIKNKSFGLSCPTLLNDKQIIETPLNIYAKIILDTVMERINLKYTSIFRFYWNYYFPGNSAVEHIDHSNSDHVSIIYNPHTSEGGTKINGNFYPDVMGQAKVFNSQTLHQGIIQEKGSRFNLNIIVRL